LSLCMWPAAHSFGDDLRFFPLFIPRPRPSCKVFSTLSGRRLVVMRNVVHHAQPPRSWWTLSFPPPFPLPRPSTLINEPHGSPLIIICWFTRSSYHLRLASRREIRVVMSVLGSCGYSIFQVTRTRSDDLVGPIACPRPLDQSSPALLCEVCPPPAVTMLARRAQLFPLFSNSLSPPARNSGFSTFPWTRAPSL